MIYKFLAISDVHWGALDTPMLCKNLTFFLEYIKALSGEIDFVVICGDYFDHRIQLNSKTALYAIHWMDEFINTCKQSGVKKIRVVKGTQEHDNDQLEAFRQYEDETGYFRIYNTTTSEELLPNLRCVFCPDETINLEEYHESRWMHFTPNPDIGFFHGNFDNVLPSIEYDRIQNNHLPTMIYEYEKFASLIRGPLISGHWHVRQNIDSLYYIGSYDRWCFGEEEPKGFLYGEYDTDCAKYRCFFIDNPLSRNYISLIYTTEDTSTPAEFAEIASVIMRELSQDNDALIRVTYMITNNDQGALTNFNNLQSRFMNNPRVKIYVKDLLKKVAKKEAKEKRLSTDKYQYIFSQAPIAEKIQQFIKDRKDIDLSVDDIEKRLKKYLE